MKKIFILLSIALLFVACQNEKTKEVEIATLDTAAFPYQIKNYSQWEMNPSQSNVALAMNAVKAFATKDTTALKPLFGDSVLLRVDNYEYKGTTSGFLQVVKQEMDKYKSIRIEMQDMESVVSKDKKTEYVSLWYKQYYEDKAGKKDSVSFFNDFKIKNGKILEWNEYVQNFMKK